MKKILLVTGPAGDAQGWGNENVTQSVKKTILESGKIAEVAHIQNRQELLQAVDSRSPDLIWSCLYHISPKSEYIGMPDESEGWVADILDEIKIPYIGPNAQTMKILINKSATHDTLHRAGIAVPFHKEIKAGDIIPEDVPYPAFVKPSRESRSVGIDDGSVVDTAQSLKKRVQYIIEKFHQPALVEEYLPGPEFTVLHLGSDASEEFLPGRVDVDKSKFGKYPILRADLRGVGLTKISKAGEYHDAAAELCRKSSLVLGCRDHIRTDMRLDAQGKLKIMEVNGIPGLKPHNSWSPQLYALYHPSAGGHNEEYRLLIDKIVSSALMWCP